jgi:hypothetical protein
MRNIYTLLVAFLLLSLLSCNKNHSPATPGLPFGPSGGLKDEELVFGVSTTDPDGDDIAYEFDWGDDSPLTLSDYYPSGDSSFESHIYTLKGTYEITVRARDIEGLGSDWSSPLTVIIDTVPFFIFISSDTIQTEEQIFDILIEEDRRLLLTVDGDILEVSDNGETSVFDTNNIKRFYEMKLNDTLRKDYDFEYYSHFCKGDNIYYACYFDWSWSSRIVKIDPQTGQENMLCYLIGLPSGTAYKDGKLWYLCQRTDPLSSGIITCYDGETGGSLTHLIAVPLSKAKGLSIDAENIFTTYENASHSFVRFRIIF